MKHDFQTDCRVLLKRELDSRIKKNPNYSMRSFAKSLDVESSYLSKLLSGKRRVTEKAFDRIFRKINVSPSEFVKLVKQKQEPAHSASAFYQLTAKQLQLMASWETFAILEIMANKKNATQRKIANFLGLNEITVKEVITNLLTTGHLIKKTDEENFIVASVSNTTTGLPTTAALSKLQKEYLKFAIQAIDNVPEERRSQTGMTFMIDSDLLPQAKILTADYRRKMSELLEGGKNKDALYQLTVSLFPLCYNKWNEG